MTFYQELQLSSTGSKQLIRNTTDKKEKRRHILIYNFKVYLVMAFCFAVVTLYSMIFGSDNSVAGVVFLLALLVLRPFLTDLVHHGLVHSHACAALLLLHHQREQKHLDDEREQNDGHAVVLREVVDPLHQDAQQGREETE